MPVPNGGQLSPVVSARTSLMGWDVEMLQILNRFMESWFGSVPRTTRGLVHTLEDIERAIRMNTPIRRPVPTQPPAYYRQDPVYGQSATTTGCDEVPDGRPDTFSAELERASRDYSTETQALRVDAEQMRAARRMLESNPVPTDARMAYTGRGIAGQRATFTEHRGRTEENVQFTWPE